MLFRFKELIEANMHSFARLLSSEHGKVLADTKGDIQRGLDVIEFYCGAPNLLKGEYTQGAQNAELWDFGHPIVPRRDYAKGTDVPIALNMVPTKPAPSMTLLFSVSKKGRWSSSNASTACPTLPTQEVGR